jgi:histidinol-phosphatase (PHP family)
LNTAGLRKECREIYPSAELLKMARARIVPITFGSDAHAPVEVGMNFAEAVALARTVGYEESCRFTRRRHEVVPF